MRPYLLLFLTLGACGSPGAGPDASVDGPAAPDAAWQDDGTPTRRACTNSFGSAMTAQHGRLDGILVSIVEPGHNGCSGDDSHVHLQVEADGAVYDVAVNVSDVQDVDYLAIDHGLPDGAWSEGWHADQAALLDYPSTLATHSTDFTSMTKAALTAALDAELADANHVSVFMTGYGPDGGHNVHRRGSGQDGAIVLRPLGPARMLLFHFATQTF